MFMTYISDIITQGEENLSIRDLNLLYIPLNLSTRNAKNVEHEMLCYSSNYLGDRNCHKRQKKIYLVLIPSKHSTTC